MIALKNLALSGLSALFLLATPMLAQSVLGTAVVEGREVVLYQDQTWAFKDAGAENCEVLSKILSFCGDQFKWCKNPPPNQVIAAQYTPDPKLYLQYIPESIGLAAGLNYDTFRQAALQYAANANRTAVANVPILLSEDIEVSGFKGKTLAYPISFQGTPLVFQNTMLLQENWSLQIQTYEIGVTTLTENHKKHHAESIALTKLTAP